MDSTVLKLGVVTAIAAALAGCGAVRDAKRAQRNAADAMTGAEVPGAALDLKGRTLQELVEFAHKSRPSMRSAALAVEDARLRLREIAADAPLASMTPWNALSANASLGYSESSKTAHWSDLKAKTLKSKGTGALSLDLLIWDFGRNAASVRAQTESILAAELSLEKEGYTVFGDVSTYYFELLRNEALVEVAITNLHQNAQHLAQAEDLYREGEAQQLDVLRARLDMARAAEVLVAASNDVTVAGANLMAAMGVSADRGDYLSVLGTRVPMLADKAPPAFRKTTYTVEEAFDFARTNAPSMQIARAKLRAASAQVDRAVADLFPSISASVSLNWTDPVWYWRWGVSAAQTLFTGCRKVTAVERAVVAMKSAESDVHAAEQALSRNLGIAIAERDNAMEALRTAIESVRQASENLDTVRSRFEVGDVSRVDFTDAVSAYAEALASRVKAFYRGQMAEAALFELTGTEPQYVDAAEWARRRAERESAAKSREKSESKSGR